MKKPNAIRDPGTKSAAFRDLLKYFVLPISKKISRTENLWEACRMMFLEDTRIVTSAMVKEAFKMPGMEEFPGGVVRPIGDFTLVRGNRILFVLDKEYDNARIEIESGRVFVLKKYEWEFVKNRLENVGKAGFKDADRD